MKAQQIIADGNFDPTDYRGIEALYLAAYGDKQLASKARRLAAERYVDDKCVKR